jgi:Bacterial Ig domain
MKTTLLRYAGTNTPPILCVKISREKRGLHASLKCKTTVSLAKLTGTAIAKGSSMKTIIRNLLASLLFMACSLQVHAQGVIDQESWPTPINLHASGVDGLFLTDEPEEQFLQSFIPSLSAIDFISMEFQSGTGSATVAVNLYEGSPFQYMATLIGTTEAVTMQSPFVNDGLVQSGVQTFDFANPITLTPGDTYYFEPVLQSGGSGWLFETIIGDTYPNGVLYVNGYPFVTQTDIWFQEGVQAVPEPAIYALFGLGILVLAYKRRSNFPMLVFACLFFSVSVLPTHASDSVTKATADAAGLTAVSPSDLPSTGGTYWVTLLNGNGGLTALPWPFLPTNLDDPTIYSITNQVFLVDTTAGKLSTSDSAMTTADATTAAQSQAASMAALIENIENPPTPPGAGGDGTNSGYGTPHPEGIQINPDGLYLTATNEVPDGLGGLGFVLFNPNGENYQLLSATNLLATNWCLGQILYYPSATGNYFNPVPMTNSMTFFRVHQAYPVMGIYNNGATATEPDPTNSDPGQVGYFYVYNYGYQTNDVTVYYSISGMAQNGIDYSNLTGVVVVSNSTYSAQINIEPIADGLKPDQTLILRLSQNTNYLINPAYAFSTNFIIANPQVYPTVNGDEQAACPEITNYDVYLQAYDPRGLTMSYKILTWPTHGLLNTNGAPYCSYIATNCYEGLDTFTFEVSDGQYTSGPATVILNIGNTVYANQITAQTCRGTPVSIQLSGGDDDCGIATNFALVTEPSHGTISNTPPNIIYTPDGTGYTGTDTWYFVCYDGCGDASTNSVTVTIGDQNAQAVGQTLITGTNDPLHITLSTSDGSDSCTADATNFFTYTTFDGPANGVLTGTGTNRLYTPAHDFEGVDSFEYNFADGFWTNQPATVTIDVVQGPIAFQDCNPFSTAILIDWMLDTNCQTMNLNIPDYIVYQSSHATGPWIPVFTNSASTDSYLDTNAVVGVTNYYTVTFQAYNSFGQLIESPKSDVVEATAHVNVPLIPYNAVWQVVTNLSTPNNITNLEAPMSNYFIDDTNQPYPGMAQLPNSYWAVGTTMSNSINMVIPTNSVPLDQVTYSIAIDNDYTVYLNGTNIQYFNHENYAIWVPYQSFEEVAPGNLHYGTNSLKVVITDEGGINYFSMIVSTNTCGM